VSDDIPVELEVTHEVIEPLGVWEVAGDEEKDELGVSLSVGGLTVLEIIGLREELGEMRKGEGEVKEVGVIENVGFEGVGVKAKAVPVGARENKLLKVSPTDKVFEIDGGLVENGEFEWVALPAEELLVGHGVLVVLCV